MRDAARDVWKSGATESGGSSRANASIVAQTEAARASSAYPPSRMAPTGAPACSARARARSTRSPGLRPNVVGQTASLLQQAQDLGLERLGAVRERQASEPVA